MTLRAAAARGLQVLVEIFFTVVVGNLLARLDTLHRFDEYPSAPGDGFTIGAARMIDVSGRIYRRLAVYGLLLSRLKKIFALAGVFLLFGENAPDVLNNPFPFLERAARKKTESGGRPLHDNALGEPMFLRAHRHRVVSIPHNRHRVDTLY